jgi:hypothetical protein
METVPCACLVGMHFGSARHNSADRRNRIVLARHHPRSRLAKAGIGPVVIMETAGQRGYIPVDDRDGGADPLGCDLGAGRGRRANSDWPRLDTADQRAASFA